MRIHIHICTHLYILCIYITYMYTSIYVMYLYICIMHLQKLRTHIYISKIRTRIHISKIHTHIPASAPGQVGIYVCIIHVYINTYIYKYQHWDKWENSFLYPLSHGAAVLYVYMYVLYECIRVHMYICIVYLHKYMYICI